jgi:hypothetical protein
MKTFISGLPSFALAIGFLGGITFLQPMHVDAAGKGSPSDLNITRDSVTGKVTVSWNGKGALKQSASLNGRFKPAKTRGAAHTVEPEGQQMLYLVDAGGAVYSVNIVGYVNKSLPPGLSLIANPLWAVDNNLETLFYQPPDGSQVYTFVPEAGAYEVSTYDDITGTWSNPDIDLSPGVGFFFNNNSTNIFVNTFVGEVHTGTLLNPFPAGFSLEGPLVPQEGSINSVHAIPGRPGDRLYFHIGGSPGNGDYIICEYLDGWVPDVSLQIAQGFMTQMQQPIVWSRVFTIGPP